MTGLASPLVLVNRGYGGTSAEALTDGQTLTVIGNAALEGDDRPDTQFTNRVRRVNYTQIFTSSVEVSSQASRSPSAVSATVSR